MSHQLSHYLVEEHLGEGPFFWVYRAFDEKSAKFVALKVLKPWALNSPSLSLHLEQIALSISKLRHPHIVELYDIDRTQGQIYLSQRLIEGVTLAERLKRGGPIDWSKTGKIVSAIGSALHYAHSQGVVHNNIKPHNILLGKDDYPYLCDFSNLFLAKAGTELLSTAAGTMIGHNYWAPEIWNGFKVTPATDVYALSCVIYEMLANKALFDGYPARALRRHFEGPRFPIGWSAYVPEEVTEILRVGLAMEPAKRFNSVEQLVTKITKCNWFDIKNVNVNAPVFRQLRLDVGISDRIVLGQSFELALAVKQVSSTILDHKNITHIKSECLNFNWPERHAYSDFKLELSAPDCKIHGENSLAFRLHPSQDSPAIFFHLTPQIQKKISIIVRAYLGDIVLGSVRVSTIVYN